MRVGNKVKCLGIGYPFMKGKVFTVSAIFDDNTFGVVSNGYGIRFDASDFEVIEDGE